MSAKKNIILLTSRDNFVWTSMQEIIPMIESAWQGLCEKNNYSQTMIDVDQTLPSRHLKHLITADVIVVTCFNLKINHFIKIIREELKIDTQIVFYLHGLATIALWPLQRFGTLELFTNNDVFVGTCQGDIHSMNLTLANAQTKKIPFTIPGFSPVSHSSPALRPFAYIGRISPQKNLDQLITAYSELSENLKSRHPLYLYGEEDHLGYPNIGLKEDNYLQKLKSLITDLKLKNHVVFKGFVNRLDIQHELGTNYIFVSATTHSDENFGMAAFRALQTGVQCVLTYWGGHIEYRKDYSSQIQYVKPYLTDCGPILPLHEFKNVLIKATQLKNITPHFPEHFGLNKIESSLKDIVESSINVPEKLQPTNLALAIFEQQKLFEANNENQRCFKSFEDPAFIAFFEAYLSQDV